MNYFFSILAGIIQGLTEFLPISSSGHLVLFHEFFPDLGLSASGGKLPDDLVFDVALHLGTLLALVWFFYKDIEKIFRGFFSSLANWNLANNFNQRLAWLIIIGTIPAVIAGYFFEDFISNNLRSSYLVALMFIIVAILFWLFEKYSVRQKDLQAMSKFDALLVGLAQLIALIPGVSRSGITIIAGLGRQLKREEAARFSFLLSVPVVFGAGLKKLIGLERLAAGDFFILLLGFLASAITGYFSIKYLLKYLSRHSLNIFAWYRLIIGCLILIWLTFF